jgi:hypothetical protein
MGTSTKKNICFLTIVGIFVFQDKKDNGSLIKSYFKFISWSQYRHNNTAAGNMGGIDLD